MVVKSKTATPEVPADENTLQLAAAKASREAFAAAQEMSIQRQAEHDDAELAEAEMEGQFNQGNDHASASDYATVRADVLRTEMLHDAAMSAERRAQSAVVNTDVTLATIAESWVQSALKGIEVKATFYAPTTPPTTAMAYVIQRTPTEESNGGSLHGKVEVRYYRPDLYRHIDAMDIQAAAERAHCSVTTASRMTQDGADGMKIDIVPITIDRGQAVIPVIKADPTSARAGSHVAHAFGADLANACKTARDLPIRGVDGEYVGASMAVKPLSGEVTSMTVDDAGIRTTTVRLGLQWRREGMRTVNVETHLQALLADWKGSFVLDFGTVTEATGHGGFPNQMIPPTTPIDVEVVFQSRVR